MFTPEFIALVVGYGLTVIGVIELLKRVLKIKGWMAAGASIVASFVICLPSLSGDVVQYIIMVACVALEANGIFKALHTPNG